MSLKCSVFGHVFGDPEVEREREEQGDEVVITVREVRTCSRCGTERVVSENKEVTTLETPSDIVGEGEDEPDGTDDAADTGQNPPSMNIDPSPTASPAGVETDSAPPPEEDDGIILDDGTEAEDEDEAPERDPGEWPEEAEQGAETGEAAEVVETDPTPDPEGVDPDPETDVEPTSEVLTVPEGTFHCPECEFSTPVEDSSLRAGDFCPECHQGTLEHERDAQ